MIDRQPLALRRLNGRPGCSVALLPFALGRRQSARPEHRSSEPGFFALLRYGRRGAPPWAPVFDAGPGDPILVLDPGIRCEACGLPHARLVCMGCGRAAEQELACDRCSATQPFDLVTRERLQHQRRISVGVAAALAGLVAGVLLGRARR